MILFSQLVACIGLICAGAGIMFLIDYFSKGDDNV